MGREHARDTAPVLRERDDKKRPGLELGWRGKVGNTEATSPRPQEEPLVPGSLHFPWPPKVLSLCMLCSYFTYCRCRAGRPGWCL